MLLFSEAPVLSDIHCHLIPYVDDGASDIEDALELVKEEYPQGVRHIVMTPHLRKNMFDTKGSDVIDRFDELKGLMYQTKIENLNLYLGREYYCDSRFKALLNGYYLEDEAVFFEDDQYFPEEEIFSFGHSRCILLEFSSNHIQKDEMYEYTELALKSGLTPVIAHAERYPYIQNKPGFTRYLRNEGAYIQVNADAVIGNDTKERINTARKLVHAGYADLIASDAHDLDRRRPSLKKCYGYLKRRIGKESADMLMNETALKLLKG
jgi:protein-tyrosine phosphatase